MTAIHAIITIVISQLRVVFVGALSTLMWVYYKENP